MNMPTNFELPGDLHASEKKLWISPEIRDQSIKSLTEAKSYNPSESSPNTGPVS